MAKPRKAARGGTRKKKLAGGGKVRASRRVPGKKVRGRTRTVQVGSKAHVPASQSRKGTRRPAPSSNATRKRSPARLPAARAPGRRGGSRVSEVEGALKVLAGRVKPGPVSVGRTRRKVTPTKAGFRALDRLVTDVFRSHKVRQRPAAFTATLKIRLRGPDGKFVALPPMIDIGLPLPAQVEASRKKGESAAHAFKRLSEDTLRRAVFRQADLMFGDYKETRDGKTWERATAAGDWKKARRALARIKKRRDLSFGVEFTRHVTGADDAEEDETE